MESSNSKTLNILSDILLELAMSIGSQLSSIKLVHKSVPLLLKRLECNTCGLFNTDEKDTLKAQFVVPGIFPKTSFFQKLQATPIQPCFLLDGQLCYFFQVSKNEYLFLRRKTPFTEIQLKELTPLLLFLVNTFHNLNEKSKREKIEKEVERLSLVASQSTNGVVITDVAGNLEWMNEGFTKITGWTLDEVKGKKPGDFLHGELTDQATVGEIRECVRNGKGFDVEILNYNKTGLPYWIKIICNPLIDSNGEITGFMAIESDISIRKKYEEELIGARNEAIQAQKAEEDFLANMSHEIRTPLNAVIGMVSLLYETNLNEEQLEYIKTLDHSSDYLLGLISNLLDIQKIQSGNIEVFKSTINFYAVLDSIYSTYENRVKEKGIKVRMIKDENIPSHIISDKTILQQILNNLMSNAEKFTEEGEIGFRVKRITWNNKLSIQIEVFDTGAGIEPDKKQYLFKKFKQIHTPKLTNTRGTGLGLAITKELVKVLEGEISVESEFGTGSVFKVKIPIELPEKKIKHQSRDKKNLSEINMFSDINILIVEDNIMNQKFIVRLLKKLNIAFDLAENGMQAIEKVNEIRYDVILMDIQLPDMNGFEVTKIIKSTQNLNAQTKIIALTASAFGQDLLKSQAVGMDDFLSKPFRPNELIEKLEIVLEL